MLGRFVGPRLAFRSKIFPASPKSAYKEDPAEAVSLKLLSQGGYVSQVSSGVFNLLPLALRTIDKINAIVDDNLQHVGAQKLQMPILQPVSLWERSGRIESLGPEMMKVQGRKNSPSPFLLGPTHEEVVTALASASVSSYRQLPLILYQIGGFCCL